ncbi:MAG: exodeoxyribonuclease VII small subunit [Polyangiaceae bacterium]|nr:exodeoxyribonuclease VII small subunit [Polyangiaceae bacterium]
MSSPRRAPRSPDPVAPTPPADEPASFEGALERLARIVEELESGNLPLEESVARFEEGTRLARAAQARLDAAEQRVEELLGVQGGVPETRELDDP